MPYIRRDTQTLADGTSRVYTSIAHNVREDTEDGGSRSKPVILARLGPEEDLDEKAVDGLIAALSRYKVTDQRRPEATRRRRSYLTRSDLGGRRGSGQPVAFSGCKALYAAGVNSGADSP